MFGLAVESDKIIANIPVLRLRYMKSKRCHMSGTPDCRQCEMPVSTVRCVVPTVLRAETVAATTASRRRRRTGWRAGRCSCCILGPRRAHCCYTEAAVTRL